MDLKHIAKQIYHIGHLKLLIGSKMDRARILRILLISACLFASWLVGYKWRDAKIWYQMHQITYLTHKHDTLQKSIIDLERNLKSYNFMISDGDYYRYLAYKHANIMIPKTANSAHLKLMTDMAIYYEIPFKYYYRLINHESGFNPNVVSSAGARSYMQVMPGTMKLMQDRYDGEYNLDSMSVHEKNIIIGTYMLNYLYKKYKRWDLVFAAYNAGSVVDECNCVPNIPETQAYVKNIINEK